MTCNEAVAQCYLSLISSTKSIESQRWPYLEGEFEEEISRPTQQIEDFLGGFYGRRSGIVVRGIGSGQRNVGRRSGDRKLWVAAFAKKFVHVG